MGSPSFFVLYISILCWVQWRRSFSSASLSARSATCSCTSLVLVRDLRKKKTAANFLRELSWAASAFPSSSTRLLIDVLWDPMVGPWCGTLWWDPGTLWRDPMVGPCGEC